MRWFKHLTTASDDETMAALIEEFGPEGYGVFWIILEKIAAQMTENDRCSIRYSIKKWSSFVQISPKKFQKIVEFLSNEDNFPSKNPLFFVKQEGKFLEIECPKLLKYRDEYSKKKARKSGQCQDNVRTVSGQCQEQDTDTDTETDTEIDTETDLTKSHSPTSASSGGESKKKSPSKSSNGVEPEYLDLATKLAGIVQGQKQIKISKQRLKSWGKEIRKLRRTDGVDMERISQALDWYGQHIGEQYVPVIESGKAFRDKFLRLEDAMKREARAGPQNSSKKLSGKGFTERNVETSIGALKLLGVEVDENGNVLNAEPG